MSLENRIGIIGNVDSGKSTLTGVLMYNEFDNGRGSAREKIFNHPHEKERGKTSSISINSIKINQNTNRSLTFIDLAGHEKYLKTTLHGLSGYFIDYAILVINGSKEGGVFKMTREHFSIILAFNIPLIIVISKIDMAQGNIIEETVKKINKMIINMCNKRKMQRDVHFINSENDFIELTPNIIPIFKISNKTGENINILRKYLYELKENTFTKNNTRYNKLFSIDSTYIVPNVGNVVCGKMIVGRVNKNDKLYIGPFNGKWIPIVAKSFHDNFRNTVDNLNINETGAIAFTFSDKTFKNLFKHSKNTKGIIIISSEENPNNLHTYYFEAMVKILMNHSTTIKEKYQPIINCGKIVQAAEIIKIYNNDVLRAGDYARIRFKFKHRPEFLEIDDMFLFREGKTKGIGKIVNIE